MNITVEEKVQFELMLDREIENLRKFQSLLATSCDYLDYLKTIYNYEKKINILLSLCDKINKEYYK